MQAAARRRGFTLLEICIVIAIAMMLMSLAVPSISGMISERRLQGSFDRFDAVVIEAQRRSITEGKAYVLSWNKNGAVRLYPAEWNGDERHKRGPVAGAAPAAGDGPYQLKRPSLSPTPATSDWTFWPTGTCEPATIRCESKVGEWQAAYNPLSARAQMQLFLAR